MAGRDLQRVTLRLFAAVSILALGVAGANAQSNVPTPSPAPRGLAAEPPGEPERDAGRVRGDTVACLEGQVPSTAVPGQPCAPEMAGDGSGTSVSPNAVFLPDILIDLFPFNPRGDTGDQSPDSTTGGEVPSSGSNGASAGGGGASPAVVASAAGATRPLAAPSQAISGEFVPDEVLVTIDGDAALVQAVAADFGLEVRSQRLSNLLGVTVARLGIPDGRPVGTVLAQLDADPRTIDRVANHVFTLQQAAAIANYAFQRIALDSNSATGENVPVAVIDTAYDETHEALSGVVAEAYDAMPGTPIVDRDHGTSVTGLLAGVGALRGMAPGSKVFHARAFESGRSTMDVILDALDWAASKDVRIINMSFVGPENELLDAACGNARARGMILVAAAGNNGPGAPYGYPAAYDGVIAVTATDETDAIMPRANRGPYVYVAAPGVNVIAPVGGGSDLVTGTSFAAAVVSGAIANLLHENPERSAEWIEAALAETAGDLGAKGRDDDFGFGLINTKAAAGLK
ncbi:MAG TPA: S8 family serine peptidase [Rhizobiaceae bacterium]|nr:S8 family serine peptidase [Rhizobiaceae bacterium]